MVNFLRIATLNKENYDTWKTQMEALLIENNRWGYKNSESKKSAVEIGETKAEKTKR